ncbi:MAG: hypothetical protein LBT50_00555 [Prevotellaceae bacterium]|jgi:hypothetical protein|nr:hypothetical protein [Prevotellaceae bacterium]
MDIFNIISTVVMECYKDWNKGKGDTTFKGGKYKEISKNHPKTSDNNAYTETYLKRRKNPDEPSLRIGTVF